MKKKSVRIIITYEYLGEERSLSPDAWAKLLGGVTDNTIRTHWRDRKKYGYTIPQVLGLEDIPYKNKKKCRDHQPLVVNKNEFGRVILVKQLLGLWPYSERVHNALLTYGNHTR